jgi:hypothetical protein
VPIRPRCWSRARPRVGVVTGRSWLHDKIAKRLELQPQWAKRLADAGPHRLRTPNSMQRAARP